jgi:hypothetical protein
MNLQAATDDGWLARQHQGMERTTSDGGTIAHQAWPEQHGQ